jgi:hypothetical protein
MALPQIPTAGGEKLARVSWPPFQGDVMEASSRLPRITSIAA